MDPSIGVRRGQKEVADDATNQASNRRDGKANGKVIAALIAADLATYLIATALADLVVVGHTRLAETNPINVLWFLACCFAFGLYTGNDLRPHERLRQRTYASLLFAAFNLSLLHPEGGVVQGVPYWLLEAALLVGIGFYAEHFVLRAIGSGRNIGVPRVAAEAENDTSATARLGAPRPAMDLAKRVGDLAVALPAVVLLLPLFALLVVAIKVIDPGPAFYVQTRVGRGGRKIRLFKFRSMYIDSERRLQEHLRTNAAAKVEWSRFYKLHDDPRILPHIGNLLRRSSMDELPQLWNVVLGDMTLVGPRPLPDYHATSFDPDFQRLRASVTPGVTGLCQVLARRSELDEQKAHDLFYIENRSIWLDLYILLQTVPAVLTGSGAR